MSLRTLIADDEPLARERLRLLLAAHPQVEIAAECRNGREAIAALKAQPIDLAFLDIQMPGNSGFEVLQEIGPAHMPLTVFVTAYNSYAIKAFEVHALDYLTKPVEPERLALALARIEERIAAKAALAMQSQLKDLLQGLPRPASDRKQYPQRILVPDRAKDAFVVVNEIEWIEAADYYVHIHANGKSLALRQPIKDLAASLDPKRFVRIHRSAIVNVSHVREILRDGHTDGWVVLTSGQRLRMSKVGWQNLLAATTSIPS